MRDTGGGGGSRNCLPSVANPSPAYRGCRNSDSACCALDRVDWKALHEGFDLLPHGGLCGGIRLDALMGERVEQLRDPFADLTEFVDTEAARGGRVRAEPHSRR